MVLGRPDKEHGGLVDVVTVGPDLAVGVEGLNGRLVAEPSLDGLDQP
jgi:hypothetical protein